MTAVAFDTLKFVRTLRDKAKMSSEQAEGLAEAVSEAIQADLATKADVLAVRTDIEALKLSNKADLAETRYEILKWVLSAIGFQALIIVGAIVALSRLAH
jgi:hypothetical protein